jgi:predicted O-methyltransferase YrrM
MDCIFLCVFDNNTKLDLLYLLLESIFTYGISNNTRILIYTTSSYYQIIKKSHLYNADIIQFEINNNYSTYTDECIAKLDIFNLPVIENYRRILYLDLNNLVMNNIYKVFDICRDDILYVIGSDKITSYNNESGFSSSILLFNKCQKIKELFKVIKDRTANSIYNASHYNNTELDSLTASNEYSLNNDKIIYNFRGKTPIDHDEINKIKSFFNRCKDDTIMSNINKAKKYIDEYLLPIIHQSGEQLEGNILMFHNTTTYNDVMLEKAKNIGNLVLNKNIKNVMEIGFNAGFSTLLMLLTNSDMKILCFDLGDHTYTMPCYLKLKETFGNRINIIIGDSTRTVKHINDKYDLIHIDGGHSFNVATSDILHSYRLSKQGTILIFDDYDFNGLHQLWDNVVEQYNLKPLHIYVYETHRHDIKYVEK